jgi:hypothetical protein
VRQRRVKNNSFWTLSHISQTIVSHQADANLPLAKPAILPLLADCTIGVYAAQASAAIQNARRVTVSSMQEKCPPTTNNQVLDAKQGICPLAKPAILVCQVPCKGLAGGWTRLLSAFSPFFLVL